MSPLLPRLRGDLDLIPSPLDDQPGLVIRDPFGYSEDVLLVPPAWVSLLQCLDGAHTELDAQALLTRLAGGEFVPRDRLFGFVEALRQSGFLETAEFERLRRQKHEDFRQKPHRDASHAGSAYPNEPDAIRTFLEPHFADRKRPPSKVPVVGIAAPHVSPEGAFATYASAYELIDPDQETTFVVLGTSHYGQPERFGLTRKAFRTPLGTVPVDSELVDWLMKRAPEAILEEDYCHAREHSIELQVIYLQYRMKAPFRILPVLCGPFAESFASGQPPSHQDDVQRFLEALAELGERRPALVWILGVDMAHIGLRYGHLQPVRAAEGEMLSVREEDRKRLERMEAGDARGFFELVHPEGDPLNWCGTSPIYSFLYAMDGGLKGKLEHYHQWNIDPGSVVSFAAMGFYRK